MTEILNQDEQTDFVRDVVNQVLRKTIMEKFGLSDVAYLYYRRKLGPNIDSRAILSENEIRADYNLRENRKRLSQLWTNLEELIAFKKTICDRTLYDKVVQEIENLSILYSNAIAYEKPIIIPERLKELDNE